MSINMSISLDLFQIMIYSVIKRRKTHLAYPLNRKWKWKLFRSW
jgi:hypothetical protein